MPLLTYQQSRPWAKAMKQAVLTQKMPPWFADPHYGHFKNTPAITQADIDTLAAWADTGAPEGDPKDAPAPREFVDGWQIGKPDAVIEMPVSFDIPASGTIDYQYIIVPTNFKEDHYIQMAEARPGNRAAVHHIIAYIREPNNTWMRSQPPGVIFVPQRNVLGPQSVGIPLTDAVAGYAPGMVPSMYQPGQAKLLKAGSDIVFQLHYTAGGKPTTDRSRVGLIFAKQPPIERVITLAAGTANFVIPPGDSDYQVHARIKLQHDSKLISMLPHMHYRGKSFEYRAIYPSGESEVLLSVPRYDFDWQLTYYLANQKVLPAGTIIECEAHYDNSANNTHNPDPHKEVRFGEQTWEEMMFGFFDVAVPRDMSLRDLLRPRRPQATQAAAAGGS